MWLINNRDKLNISPASLNIDILRGQSVFVLCLRQSLSLHMKANSRYPSHFLNSRHALILISTVPTLWLGSEVALRRGHLKYSLNSLQTVHCLFCEKIQCRKERKIIKPQKGEKKGKEERCRKENLLRVLTGSSCEALTVRGLMTHCQKDTWSKRFTNVGLTDWMILLKIAVTHLKVVSAPRLVHLVYTFFKFFIMIFTSSIR